MSSRAWGVSAFLTLPPDVFCVKGIGLTWPTCLVPVTADSCRTQSTAELVGDPRDRLGGDGAKTSSPRSVGFAIVITQHAAATEVLARHLLLFSRVS